MTLKTTMLDAIKSPADLRRVNEKDLAKVADDLRAETISAVAVTGVIIILATPNHAAPTVSPNPEGGATISWSGRF